MHDCLQISQAREGRVPAGRRLGHQIRNSFGLARRQKAMDQQYQLQIYNLFYLFQRIKENPNPNPQAPPVVFDRFAFIIYFITFIINDMINPTFASFKLSKQGYMHSLKTAPSRRTDNLPTSFKEIRQYKQGNLNKNANINSNKKTLENQQNTFFNTFQDQLIEQTVRKNLIKVDKSKKKVNQTHVYKSPSHKIFEINPLYSKDKTIQTSNYKARANIHRNDENLFVFTPSIIKNHSFTRGENYSKGAFLTAKQNYTENSEQGSISISSKASFDSSFNLHPTDISYQEDEKGLHARPDNVNSSMEIQRQAPICSRTINDFNKYDNQHKTMKKSRHFYCSNLAQEERVFKTEEDMSVSSSISSNISNSINFTQKFKHYKRQHTKSQLKTQPKTETSPCLAQFKLQNQIGSGKYGKVFLARHRSTGFTCAIKSVSKKIIKDENLEIPFIREVKIQMYLNHPNIVKLYGFFHDQENVYLIMEYCSGSHLFKMIRQKKQFEQWEIVSILSNVFEAVSYIHCHGIIHRDLKPENIVIQSGVYKLCDFGWAAYACGDSRTTFCGTPLYVCPEVLKGEEYNSKADIWGLGIITYELTFGHVPFSIISQSDLMKIIKDPVYFPVWGHTSEKLIPFIKGMLSKHPNERPSLNQILSSEIFRTFSPKTNSALKLELNHMF